MSDYPDDFEDLYRGINKAGNKESRKLLCHRMWLRTRGYLCAELDDKQKEIDSLKPQLAEAVDFIEWIEGDYNNHNARVYRARKLLKALEEKEGE